MKYTNTTNTIERKNLFIILCLDCEMKRNNPEHLPWVRPVTCAAIAVSALIFFMLLYFGKTWTESRVSKVRFCVIFLRVITSRGFPGAGHSKLSRRCDTAGTAVICSSLTEDKVYSVQLRVSYQAMISQRFSFVESIHTPII